MLKTKRQDLTQKSHLHARNRHRERYDFKLLSCTSPELNHFVKLNEYGDESIDFFNPLAVKALNKSLLKHYYDIDYWDIPNGYLCPPIPGRADYIHCVADVLAASSKGQIHTGADLRVLDIGVGANCVYPIIGHKEYGWSFVGSDIDPLAIASAQKIINANPLLTNSVELRLQAKPINIFEGIIQPGEKFDLTICNPPFHASLSEAQASSRRKLSNLKQKKINKPILNFAGQSNELWCTGGEVRFIKDMIQQSKQFAKNIRWFSTLVSKGTLLPQLHAELKAIGATDAQVIPMGQGNKMSRVVVWTFL